MCVYVCVSACKQIDHPAADGQWEQYSRLSFKQHNTARKIRIIWKKKQPKKHSTPNNMHPSMFHIAYPTQAHGGKISGNSRHHWTACWTIFFLWRILTVRMPDTHLQNPPRYILMTGFTLHTKVDLVVSLTVRCTIPEKKGERIAYSLKNFCIPLLHLTVTSPYRFYMFLEAIDKVLAKSTLTKANQFLFFTEVEFRKWFNYIINSGNLTPRYVETKITVKWLTVGQWWLSG